MKKWLKIIEAGICEEGSQREKLFVFPSNSDKSEELTTKGEKAGGDSGYDPETQTVPWPLAPADKAPTDAAPNQLYDERKQHNCRQHRIDM
jgi:hypothetical protein